MGGEHIRHAHRGPLPRRAMGTRDQFFFGRKDSGVRMQRGIEMGGAITITIRIKITSGRGSGA